MPQCLKKYWPMILSLTIVVAILGGICLSQYSRPYIYLLTKTSVIQKMYGLFLFRWGTFEQITPPNIYPIDFSWSPSGDKIALRYSSDPIGYSPENYIGIWNMKTKELTSLLYVDRPRTHNGVPAKADDDGLQRIHFAWSPDGKKILLNMLSPENNQQLYLLDVQTKEITPTALIFPETQDKRNYNIGGITWAPGPFPVFEVCFDISEFNPGCALYTTNNEFTELKNLTDNSFSSFQWLTDGETLVYSCLIGYESEKSPDVNQFGLCSYSSKDRQFKVITTKFSSAYWWSPDGLLAFSVRGGAEGGRDPIRLLVYNVELDRVDELPGWLYEWVGEFAP
jgi:hypothetical protein